MGKGIKRSAALAAESDDSDAGAPVAKKTKSSSSNSRSKGAGGANKDDDGNDYWEPASLVPSTLAEQISKNRRVTLSEFKGKTLINIREFYEKDGKTLPGKKGISLTLEQYQVFLKAMPAINAGIKEQTGQDIDGVGDDDDGPAATVPTAKKPRSTKKSNIEATSDEDEE